MENKSIFFELIYDKEILIDSGCLLLGGSFEDGGVWDKSTIESVYQILMTIKDPVMLDVGANAGSFSLIAKFIPGLTVYAFEPFDEIYDFLNKNIKLNDLSDRIKAFNLACFNKVGEDVLKCCGDKKSGMSTLGPNFKLSIPYIEKKVQTDTIDNVIKREGIKKVDFIKIDVEGSDLYVLEGAIETLKQFKPKLIVECSDERTVYFNYKSTKIREFLDSLGYRIITLIESNILAVPGE